MRLFNEKFTPFLFLLLLIPTICLSQTTITGKVISVADGDTITILSKQKKQIKIRLSAVDCPESGQAYGKKAKKFTYSMVYGKQVIVEPETTDRYGRTVAMVYTNGSNLSKQIISNGYGWVYRKYCKQAFCDDWLQLESRARVSRIGLWRDKSPQAPWDWRKAKRNSSSPVVQSNSRSSAVPGGSGIYHGNVKSHVFHGSGCRYYNCKNCTMVFKSVNEAERAGYRAHRDCVQ